MTAEIIAHWGDGFQRHVAGPLPLIVLLEQDGSDDTIDGVNAYQQEVAKFDYQVLLGGSDAKVKFQQSVLPTTYLIDRQGRIRQKIIGARDKAAWEAAVRPLLAETPATASAAN